METKDRGDFETTKNTTRWGEMRKIKSSEISNVELNYEIGPS